MAVKGCSRNKWRARRMTQASKFSDRHNFTQVDTSCKSRGIDTEDGCLAALYTQSKWTTTRCPCRQQLVPAPQHTFESYALCRHAACVCPQERLGCCHLATDMSCLPIPADSATVIRIHFLQAAKDTNYVHELLAFLIVPSNIEIWKGRIKT